MDLTIDQRRLMIEPNNPNLSITKQCQLLGMNRASYYYIPKPETELNLLLMELIDRQYTKRPTYGVPTMTAFLRRKGYKVNRKRVRRLMRKMSLVAIYAKPRTSIPNDKHSIYPYLLNNLNINSPNQVWCADITYIRLNRGFLYLFAIMDWFSRYVVSWELSNTLDNQFCIDGLDKALDNTKPTIFNTDQGSQFTSKKFTSILEDKDIKISMDGRGRVFDNIFVERLWRTVKQEEVYIHEYKDGIDAYLSLENYFQFYNQERLHSTLGYSPPSEIYYGKKENEIVKKKVKQGIVL